MARRLPWDSNYRSARQGMVCTIEPSVSVDDRELTRIRGEYGEMPGLCLTQCQAQRLWGLPCDRCEALLTALIEERFLVRTVDGRFVRRGAVEPRLRGRGGWE